MKFEQLAKLKIDNIILKKIIENDQTFISEMFLDKDVCRYYIVDKEVPKGNNRLVNDWLNDIANGAGYAWLIYIKEGLFSSQAPCGFIAFEFRGSVKNVNISYALIPGFRRKGIITRSLHLVINELKQLGIESINADIDQHNSASEKVMEGLGFKADKTTALFDFESKPGELKMRFLWKKNLLETEDFINKKRHFDFILAICSININQNEQQIILDDLNKNKHYSASFHQIMDPRITFLVDEYIRFHSFNEADAFSVPNEEKPAGPLYKTKDEQFQFILEAFLLVLILDNIFGEIRLPVQKIKEYSLKNNISVEKLNNVLVKFQDRLKLDPHYATDIRRLNLRQIIKEIIAKA